MTNIYLDGKDVPQCAARSQVADQLRQQREAQLSGQHAGGEDDLEQGVLQLQRGQEAAAWEGEREGEGEVPSLLLRHGHGGGGQSQVRGEEEEEHVGLPRSVIDTYYSLILPEIFTFDII